MDWQIKTKFDDIQYTATFLHTETENRIIMMTGSLLNTGAQMKFDQKQTQSGMQKSWVLCGHHTFNITSILH